MATALMEENVKVCDTGRVVTKIDRYGWILRDMPGVFMEIHKRDLNVDHEYQRDKVFVKKVREIAASWSWAGCGAILVAARADGTYWVFDGQHRVMAARMRSDISDLPCLVFECSDKTQEAAGFIVSNTLRKNVTATAKFKALVMTGDETAVYLSKFFESRGLALDGHSDSAGVVSCVSACMVLRKKVGDDFDCIFDAAAIASAPKAVHKDILVGLAWVHSQHGLCGNRAFVRRLASVGRDAILDSVGRFAAAEGKRSTNVNGRAVMTAVNKGLRSKFGSSEE